MDGRFSFFNSPLWESSRDSSSVSLKQRVSDAITILGSTRLHPISLPPPIPWLGINFDPYSFRPNLPFCGLVKWDLGFFLFEHGAPFTKGKIFVVVVTQFLPKW